MKDCSIRIMHLFCYLMLLLRACIPACLKLQAMAVTDDQTDQGMSMEGAGRGAEGITGPPKNIKIIFDF